MNWIKKTLLATGCSAAGLILLPILSLPVGQQNYQNLEISLFLILLVYFLPGSVIVMIITTEILNLVPQLQKVLSFLGSKSMLIVFIILLFSSWAIIKTVHWTNDIVFASQFAAAFVIPLYAYVSQTKKFEL